MAQQWINSGTTANDGTGDPLRTAYNKTNLNVKELYASIGTSGSSGISGTSGTSGTVGPGGTSGTNGSSGTSGTSGNSGTSGSSGTSGTSGINGAVNQYSLVLESPTNGENITMGFTPVAVTVIGVYAGVLGTTPSVTINPTHGTDRSSATNNILTAPVAITGTTTAHYLSSFSDPTIPAGSWIVFKSTAKSGTVTEVSASIKYTVD